MNTNLITYVMVGTAALGAIFYLFKKHYGGSKEGHKMSEEEYIDVLLDLLPNQPKNDKSRESFRQLLRDRFEKSIPEAVERVWDLPPLILKAHGDYLDLLNETRQLYILGYFYSCVAMCGIVGERLVKDVLRAFVCVQKSG